MANARCRAEDAISILRERLDDNPQAIEGSFSRKNGVLRVCSENQRFWSPCLDLTIDEASESSSDADAEESEGDMVKVWGTFSPRPEIWTGFVFAIGTALVVSLLAVIFGFAQFMLGEAPWALVIPPIAFLIMAGIYLPHSSARASVAKTSIRFEPTSTCVFVRPKRSRCVGIVSRGF